MRFCYFGIYDPEFSRNRIYIRALRDAGHTIIECRDTSRGLMKYVRLVQRLRALEGSYDVIIVGYPGHIVVPLARLFGAAPVVSDLLGSLSDAAEHTYDAGFFVRTWYSWVDRLAIACSDTVLVDSELQKEYLQRRFGSGKKYRVVYTGADEEVFGPRGERDVTRTEPFIVLFRGRLIPQSGIMHILDAAKSLQNDKRFAFRIIGYGPLLKVVRERARGLSNVELISEHISFDAMRRLTLDVGVSLGQFGNNARSDRNIPHKAFESISMGIPYLTARVPGISELLEDEVSCLMVPLENADAIKAALQRLRDDRPLGKRLAEKARAVYESHASGPVISSAITAISASCIEAKKQPVTRSFLWMGKREAVAVLLLLAAFIAIRILGLSLPYHQDEAKIGELVRSHMVGALSGHPPLTELLYLSAGDMVGSDHLRLIPLAFGVLSAILLYAIMRRRTGVHAALAALSLYAICMYGVFASLMVDTDGAVLPTLFLAAVYAYDRFRDSASVRSSYAWLAVLALALVVGFLTKLSFVLVLGALALDYIFEMRHRLTRGLLVRAAIAALGCCGFALAAIASTHFFLPSFDASQTIIHALYYVRFEGRGYLQILIQAVKAVFYLSPLLLIPLVFLSKDALAKNRIFVVYLALGAIFYFILFDFSQGALDKYLMFTVVPLAALVGTILADALRGLTMRSLVVGTLIGTVCAAVLVALNFLSPEVMPLYPKTEWISAIAHGHWNILFVFTGGDGPTGFYVSFLVIAVGFLVSFALAVIAYVSRMRQALLVALIVLGVAFNGIFIEEFLFGRINGSAPDALRASLEYIQNADVAGVITHAEAGAYELRGMGKFSGRFYAVPGYEEGHRALFAAHTGQYLVVDIPHLNERGFYSKFFSTCTPVFVSSSGVIRAYVYDCAGSDPYAIK